MNAVFPAPHNVTKAFLENDTHELERSIKTLQNDHVFGFEAVSFKDGSWPNFIFKKIYFSNCIFENFNFKDKNITGATFHSCTFKNCIFDNAVLGGQIYSTKQLDDLNSNPKATSFALGCHINSCSFVNVRAIAVSFSRTSIKNSNFENANLKRSIFDQVSISHTNFRKTLLDWCEFGKWVTWEKNNINSETSLYNSNFIDKYGLDIDRSETFIIDLSDKPTWSGINFLSNIPIFQASFSIFLLSLFIANVILTLNTVGYIQTIDYPIPLPRQLVLVLISSFSLFLGAFLYRIGCPKEVQNFSESEWVIEHNRARPLYILKTLQNRNTKLLCLFFLVIGATTTLYLIFCRILDVCLGLGHPYLYCH